MTPLTPEMIERAARAVEPYVFSDEYASYWPDRAKRNREEVRRRVRIVIEAALGEGVTGWKLVGPGVHPVFHREPGWHLQKIGIPTHWQPLPSAPSQPLTTRPNPPTRHRTE